MIGFCSREEKINLSILVLQNQFGSIFVWKYSEDRVIWFVLHDYIFILDVIILQSISVVQINKKDFSQEVLNYLSVPFNREDFLLAFTFDLNQMNFILVI